MTVKKKEREKTAGGGKAGKKTPVGDPQPPGVPETPPKPPKGPRVPKIPPETE